VRREEATKGPWFFEAVWTSERRDPAGWHLQIQGERTGVSAVIIADLPLKFDEVPAEGTHSTWEKQAANARLLAAAPALAATVEQLRDWLLLVLSPSGHLDNDLQDRLGARDAARRADAVLKEAGLR